MTAGDRPISQCDLCGRITQVRETYHGTIICVDNQTCVARRDRRPRAGDHSTWPRRRQPTVCYCIEDDCPAPRHVAAPEWPGGGYVKLSEI